MASQQLLNVSATDSSMSRNSVEVFKNEVARSGTLLQSASVRGPFHRVAANISHFCIFSEPKGKMFVVSDVINVHGSAKALKKEKHNSVHN
jgi:hypothetical protein